MRGLLKLMLVAAILPAAAASDAELAAQRRSLAEEVTAERVAQPPRRFDPRVREAMAKVPRHLFVPASQQRHAYEDRPLPIGHGQTISQPRIVALMTDLLELREGDRVLEIGTGSGYQAAVLAELARRVYTIEIVEPLGIAARERLARLGYGNVEVRIGDGYQGWEEHAPFDAIMVTAGADQVPPPLLRQLKPGGRMVIPVGPAQGLQFLSVIEKRPDGTIRESRVAAVRFVPFTRGR